MARKRTIKMNSATKIEPAPSETPASMRGFEAGRSQVAVERRSPLVGDPAVIADAAPFPVKLYTLGRFAIEIRGEPLVFKRRVPRKPLELLKAIVALGARNVSAMRVVDELWPQAHGSKAGEDALATALRRLRALLGSNEAVLLRNNRLWLNPARVWIDAQAFEVIADGSGDDPQNAQRLLALYRGGFMDEETDDPWIWPVRERLRSKLLRGLMSATRRLEGEGRHREIIALLEPALDVEPTAEELYAALMRAYRDLGRNNEALSIYQRCAKTLGALLGVRPSPETEAIHKSLRDVSL
jgi:LuxR family transcriptional regulator, maltose regulon positive regulatory protein